MKTKYMICSTLAVLLLCSYAVCLGASEQSSGLHTENEAVGIVLDILRSELFWIFSEATTRKCKPRQ